MTTALQHHLCSLDTAQQQLQIAYNAGAPSVSHPLYGSEQNLNMAYPLLRHQYHPAEYSLDMPDWRQQPQQERQQQHQHQAHHRRHLQHHAQLQHHQRMPYQLGSTDATSTSSPQDHFWMNPSTLDSSFAWDNALPTDPFIVPKVEPSMHDNTNIALDCTAIQGAWTNSEAVVTNASAWTLSCIGGLPSQNNVHNTNQETTILPSQSGVHNGNLDNKTYAFGPVLSSDHASPATEWSTVGSVFSQTTEGTSPASLSSVPMLIPTRTFSSSGLSTNSFDSPTEGGVVRTATLTESPDAYRQQVSAAFAFDGTPSCGSTYPYSHDISPGNTQWCPPGYSPGHSGLPPTPPNAQTAFHRQTHMLESSKDHRTKLSQAQWTGFVTEIPERDEQDDPPVMQNADSDARRKSDDEILMKCKAEGITYKEIKKRLRTKVAESTLRGRYRALTKPRKDRVRKPVWTENDVTLLGDFVQRELARIGRRDPSLNRSARLSKIQWLKVVEYIEKHGSYRFGVATAKKKYLEISGGH